MQKKTQKHKNKITKQIILYTLIAIIVILLLFAEDITKLIGKNNVALSENTKNQTILAKENIPASFAGMIPIKWNGENWEITTNTDKDWYDYKNGKPAYAMLNDGVYQSELIRDMTNKKLAEENIGNNALVVPNVSNNNPTILMWIPRFAINDETNDIKYIKGVEQAEEGWTIPEMFIYKQEETMPDFLLTGIWVEKDVDNLYESKINQMNSEDSIYGFVANTKAVISEQITGNEIATYYQKLIENVGESIARPPIDDITNPNRIILKKINSNNQDPIKVKVEYNVEIERIEIEITYSKYAINKILLDETNELIINKKNGIITSDTGDINIEELADKENYATVTIIDSQSNKKKIRVKINSVYVALYTDGTLAFGKSENPIPTKKVSRLYGDILDNEYTGKYWDDERYNIL